MKSEWTMVEIQRYCESKKKSLFSKTQRETSLSCLCCITSSLSLPLPSLFLTPRPQIGTSIHTLIAQKPKHHIKNNQQNTQWSIHYIEMYKLTLRSTVVSGISNSPIIHNGIAPPHGFALSILRSNNTVSTFFSWANISAAHAPDGPPPTTATLYFMSNVVEEEEDDEVVVERRFPVKDDGVNAAAEPKRREESTSFIGDNLVVVGEVRYCRSV